MTLGVQIPGEAYCVVDVKSANRNPDADVFAVLITNDSGIPIFRQLLRGKYTSQQELEAGMWNALQNFIKEAKEDELESCRTKSGRCIVHNEALGMTSRNEQYKITSALEVRTGSRVEDIVESTMRAFNEQLLMNFLEHYQDTLTQPVELSRYASFKPQVLGLYTVYQSELQKTYNTRIYNHLSALDAEGTPMALRAEINGMGFVVDEVLVQNGHNGFVDAVRNLLSHCPPLIDYIKPALGTEQLNDVFQVDTIRQTEVDQVQTRLEILANTIDNRYSTLPEWSAGLKKHYQDQVKETFKKIKPPATYELFEVWNHRYEKLDTIMKGVPGKAEDAEEGLRCLLPACNAIESARVVNYLYLELKDVAPMLGVSLIRPINDPRLGGVSYV